MTRNRIRHQHFLPEELSDRFNAFVARVGEALASGHHTFEYSAPVGPDGVGQGS